MSEDEEDTIRWEAEANAVIDDIKSFVKEICIAREVPPSDNKIYLNLTTLENKRFCVELSPLGYRVVGNSFNKISDISASNKFYETPYALLNTLSPGYNENFGNILIEKLKNLQNNS